MQEGPGSNPDEVQWNLVMKRVNIYHVRVTLSIAWSCDFRFQSRDRQFVDCWRHWLYLQIDRTPTAVQLSPLALPHSFPPHYIDHVTKAGVYQRWGCDCCWRLSSVSASTTSNCFARSSLYSAEIDIFDFPKRARHAAVTVGLNHRAYWRPTPHCMSTSDLDTGEHVPTLTLDTLGLAICRDLNSLFGYRGWVGAIAWTDPQRSCVS